MHAFKVRLSAAAMRACMSATSDVLHRLETTVRSVALNYAEQAHNRMSDLLAHTGTCTNVTVYIAHDAASAGTVAALTATTDITTATTAHLPGGTHTRLQSGVQPAT